MLSSSKNVVHFLLFASLLLVASAATTTKAAAGATTEAPAAATTTAAAEATTKAPDATTALITTKAPMKTCTAEERDAVLGKLDEAGKNICNEVMALEDTRPRMCECLSHIPLEGALTLKCKFKDGDDESLYQDWAECGFREFCPKNALLEPFKLEPWTVTTAAPATTKAAAEATTKAADATTAAPAVATTEAPAVATTEAPAEATTKAITTTKATTTTTAHAVATTEAPAVATTEAPAVATTEAPAVATTEAPAEATTEAAAEATTAAPAKDAYDCVELREKACSNAAQLFEFEGKKAFDDMSPSCPTPAPATKSDSKDKPAKKDNGGMIGGIIAGVVGLLAIVGGVMYWQKLGCFSPKDGLPAVQMNQP